MMRESRHDRHDHAHGPTTVLLCTDGSDLALTAIRQGLALLTTPGSDRSVDGGAGRRPDARDRDGFAGGVMSFDEKNDLVEAQRDAAQITLDETVAGTGPRRHRDAGEAGDAGRVICEVAASLPRACGRVGHPWPSRSAAPR